MLRPLIGGTMSHTSGANLVEVRGPAIQERRRRLDWEELYRRLKERESQPGGYGAAFINRRRIWESTMLPTIQIMASVRDVPLQGEPRKSGYDPNAPHGAKGYTVAGVTWAPLKRWSIASNDWMEVSTYLREVFLRNAPLRAMSAYFVTISDRDYLTGLRFLYDEEDPVCLGWVLDATRERRLPVQKALTRRPPGRLTRRGTVSKSSTFTGFHIATDRNGIRAIAAAAGQQRISNRTRWAGRAAGLRHVSAVLRKPASSVKAHFDASRLALGI